MTVSAPAKINLTLEVTGVEDNGYHTLDTLFAWLELEDELTLEKASGTSLAVSADGVSTDLVTTDHENLVLKAQAALEESTGKSLPTRFTLLKRIPAGGGLGGGSADAAAALVGLNRLHDLDLSQDELLRIGRGLGADVSFGLVGGMARGTRYGDDLTPVTCDQALLKRTLCLVLPDISCPTPKVYENWDESPVREARGASERFLQARDLSSKLAEIANDLEEPAFRLFPLLRVIKQKMVGLGLEGVCLSGSGSTLFGFLPPQMELKVVESGLAEFRARVVATRLSEDVRFELVS